MKRKYKNITIPYYFFDKKKNQYYYLYRGKRYTKLNELFKDFINFELTYHIEINKKDIVVHNLEDVVKQLLKHYQTFKIAQEYYDEYSKYELAYIKKLQRDIQNNKLCTFSQPKYYQNTLLYNLTHLKEKNFSKKIFKEYKEVIIPQKIYSKEYKTNYYVVAGKYYDNIFNALDQVYSGSLYYQFGGSNYDALDNHFHQHEFGEVIREIFNLFDKFEVHQFQKKFYASQELILLDKICNKLKKMKYKPIYREFDKANYDEYRHLKENKKYLRLFIHYLKNDLNDIKYRKAVLNSHKIKEK